MKNMKPIIGIGLSVMALAIVLAIFLSGSKLKHPESITFDPVGNRFLISNTGNGSIVAMDEDGKISHYMKKAFDAPKGIFLRDGIMYVADVTKVHIVDVASATITASIDIEGAKGLNDIAIGENSQLYITDLEGNCVYIYDQNSKTQEKIVSPLLKKPNGIIYDRPRWQMFIVGFDKHSPVLSLNTQDKSVNIFMDSIYSELDGIAIDDLGRIFFTSWAEEMIIEIPQEQNRFITELKGYPASADLYYHLPTNELLVPRFNENRIDRIKLD